MIQLAEVLSKGFNHVRVDFYRLNDGTIYFGEMTFTSASGTCEWNDESINQYFGSLIKLPKLAYNIDTGKYYKLHKPSIIKKYLLFPYYLIQSKLLAKHYCKKIKTFLCTFRIDIKNLGSAENAVSITAQNAQISTPAWFTNAQGIGQVVNGASTKQKLTIKAIKSGTLQFNFRGQDKRNPDNTRFPLWIDYKSIKIDGKELLSMPVATWHDKPYRYEMSVKDGQQITVEFEQQPHPYTIDELKDTILKLNPNSAYIAKNIDKIADYVFAKNSNINYICTKLSKYPTIKADCFIPIGEACRVAHQLRKHNIREASLPFDWVGGCSLNFILKTIKTGINDWFNEWIEDKSQGTKTNMYVYDTKNQFRSRHFFPLDTPVKDYMPIFKETFTRRYNKMINMIKSSKVVCFVCNNRPDSPIDFYNFIKEVQKLYPHKKYILLSVKHSNTENSITTINSDKNITIYHIKTYDIHEKGNDKKTNGEFWKGNTKLWNKICARLSLNSTDKKSTENIKAAFKHFLYHKVKTDSYTKTYICGVRVRKKPANIYSFIDKRLAEFSKTLDAKFAELSKQLAQNSAKTQKDLLAKIADSSKIEQNNFTSLQKDINNKFNNLEKETQLVKSNGLYTIKALNKKLDSLFGMQNTTADFLSAAQKENRDDLLAATEELRENLLNNSAANRQAILGQLEKVLNVAAEHGKTLQTAQQNLQSTAESAQQAIIKQIETAESAQQAIIKQIETAQSTQQTILGQAEHLKAAVGSQIIGFETLQNSQNETIKSLLAAETAKAEQKFAEQSKNYDILSKKIDNTTSSVITAVERDQILYTNPFEVRTREERGLCDIVNAPDFTNRFRKLIANLPQESVATIVNIIKRLQLIKGTNNKLDLYSAEEKELMKSLKSYFQSILKISDNLYCCQNYFLPINHFEPSVFFYKHGLDKLKNLNYFKNKAILDIGAFIGDSALILSPLTTDKVYSFEATTENYNNMLKTIELNNLTNVVAIKTAVGSENTNIDIRYEGSASSSSELMIKEPKYIEKCPVIRIDDYVKEHNLNVGLIKVDIEGAEQDFLKGAMQTIKEYKPTMLISIYHNIDDFLDIKPMIESWNLGYKFTIFKPVIGSISGETLLICEQ